MIRRSIVLPLAIAALLLLAACQEMGQYTNVIEQVAGQAAPGLTESDFVQGVKEALRVGTKKAVGAVGRKDGYFKTPQIKIPLPDSVVKLEKGLRTIGLGRKVDEFHLSMNRAAEKAAPQAASIFWNAIKKMSIADAKQIVKGGEDAATRYFRDKTEQSLAGMFKPKIHQAMADVGATNLYQQLSPAVNQLSLGQVKMVDLDEYVTGKALDGLFYMLAQEEKRIRTDPAARITEILKKVFG